MKKPVILLTFILFSGLTHAQNISVQQYIETYKSIAIAEMKRTGIPASVTLAQGILETESGNSDLVKRSNNHFGIKCKSTWTGESVTHTDDAPNECFRKYSKAEDSYRDHSDYLSTAPRYASLFKLEADDYRGWCYGLKKAGYATNPRYPQILMSNIDRYHLHQYDALVAERDYVQTFADAKMIGANDVEKIVVISPVNLPEATAAISVKDKVLFNNLKAVFVNRGTSLLAIATNADIPLSRLLEFNDLKTDGLLNEEQWIYLERKAGQGNRDFYTALQNETLHAVAQTNGIQLQSLMQFNGMTEDQTVRKGEKIKLRSGVDAAAFQRNKEQVHTVQPKEGLYAISKRYNVPVQQIKELNDLAGDGLKPGQQLIISK